MEHQDAFPSLRELPLEVRLSAWLDGQTNDEESAELEALVNSDPAVQDLLDQLVAGSDFGKTAFDAMLNEPVPLHLVRAIKDFAANPQAPAAPVRMAANSNSILAFMPRLMAASIVLLLAGGYSGYYIGHSANQPMPQTMSETDGLETVTPIVVGTAEDDQKTRGFQMPANPDAKPGIPSLDETMAGFLKVYSAQGAHLSEMPVSDQEAIRVWLSEAIDVDLTIPDLSADGFTFAGARLLAANDRPMGTLFYRNDMGDTLMVGIYRPGHDATANSSVEKVSFTTKPVNALESNVFYGFGDGVAMYVAMPDTIANGDALVEKVRSAF